jgi:hypothetical protein
MLTAGGLVKSRSTERIFFELVRVIPVPQVFVFPGGCLGTQENTRLVLTRHLLQHKSFVPVSRHFCTLLPISWSGVGIE